MPVIAAGGISNHVHLLFALPPTVPLSKAIQVFKANSSRWLGEHGIDFEWQEGYGAFSVSASNTAAVKAYIEEQERHHARRNFEDEFTVMLKKAGKAHD
jgi:putative transposase